MGNTKRFTTQHLPPPVVIHCYYIHMFQNVSQYFMTLNSLLVTIIRLFTWQFYTTSVDVHTSCEKCKLRFVTDLSLKYKYGRLVLEVPLPSRNEQCLFFLKPMVMSVGDLIEDLQREDSGANVSVFSKGMPLETYLQVNDMLVDMVSPVCQFMWSWTASESCLARYLWIVFEIVHALDLNTLKALFNIVNGLKLVLLCYCLFLLWRFMVSNPFKRKWHELFGLSTQVMALNLIYV